MSRTAKPQKLSKWREKFASLSNADLGEQIKAGDFEVRHLTERLAGQYSLLRRLRRELAIRSRAHASLPGRPAKCPHCGPARIRLSGRHGLLRRQQFLCTKCRRAFYDPRDGKAVLRRDYGISCSRCKGKDVVYKGTRKNGGRAGYCNGCKRYFKQGGTVQAEKGIPVLRERIKALGMFGEVAEVAFQNAFVAVASGLGYPDTVPLQREKSYAEVNGDYKKIGLDHPAVRDL